MTTDLNPELSIADELEHYMLELTNAARAAEGLHALQLEQHLNVSSAYHSIWMIEEDTFSHTGVDGTTPHERIVDADFNLAGQWWTGENLAMTVVDNDGSYLDEIDAMFEGLMNSPGHRANILNENYDYIGFGIEFGMFDWPDNQGNWFTIVATQNFGATGGEVVLDTGAEDETPGEGEGSGDPGGSTEPPVTEPPVTEDQELVGEDTDDVLEGGSGDDDIRGLRGDDRLSGGDGDDIIKGGIGNDTIEGGAGNDTLSGGTGDDIISGGEGVNKLVGQRGNDQIYGGDARDVLNGGGDNDILMGEGGNDRLKGGGGDDMLDAGDDPDKVYGNNGADSLFGGAGDDLLNGGGDTDYLEGGSGDDRVKGGSGSDVFVFAEGADVDRLVDFTLGEDVLLIDSSYWGSGESAADLLAEHASVQSGRVVIDFGGGDQIILQNLSSLDGLADSIDMI